MKTNMAKCIPLGFLAALTPSVAHAIAIKTPNVPTVHIQLPHLTTPRFKGHIVTRRSPGGGLTVNPNLVGNIPNLGGTGQRHLLGGNQKNYQPPPGTNTQPGSQQSGLHELSGNEENVNQAQPGNQQSGLHLVGGNAENINQAQPGDQQSGLHLVGGDAENINQAQPGNQQNGNSANNNAINAFAPNVGGLGSSNQPGSTGNNSCQCQPANQPSGTHTLSQQDQEANQPSGTHTLSQQDQEANQPSSMSQSGNQQSGNAANPSLINAFAPNVGGAGEAHPLGGDAKNYQPPPGTNAQSSNQQSGLHLVGGDAENINQAQPGN